jgi:Zn-dependent M32 family carboxypeptidase
MVKAIINIDDHTNRILNIIKAKYGLKDKSAAIIKMAEEYENVILEPELKPEYIEKLKEIEKTEAIEVGTVENLRKRYGL